MWRKNSWCLAVIFSVIILILTNLTSASIRINEIMPKTPKAVYGGNCEWIEVYSDEPIEITNWNINTGTDAQEFNFDYSLHDFLIITKNKTLFLENWQAEDSKVIEINKIALNDNGDGVVLIDEDFNVVDSFIYESSNQDKSWQFFENKWQECEPTPGNENFCENGENETNTNNNSQNQTSQNNIDEQENNTIILKLEFPDEIYLGKEFKVTLKVENIKDIEYDVKIEINKNGNTLSEIYNKEIEDWRSSFYYLSSVMNRREIEKDFFLNITKYGEEAEMIVKIRESGNSEIKAERMYEIEILEQEDREIDGEQETKITEEIKDVELTGHAVIDNPENKEKIKLGMPKDIKNKTNTLYISKSEKIRVYGTYAFSVFFLLGALLFLLKVSNKNKGNKGTKRKKMQKNKGKKKVRKKAKKENKKWRK